MPVFNAKDALAALDRQITIGQSDTCQSHRVANFLLAWGNAGSCGGFDFTDLWMVDRAIADDILTVSPLIAANHVYPGEYGFKAEFQQLVGDWRPHLLAGPEPDRA